MGKKNHGSDNQYDSTNDALFETFIHPAYPG